MIFVFLSLAFLISLIGVGVMRDFALAKGLVDVPNDRSSHTELIPRGGGLAIVFTFFVMSAVLFIWTMPDALELSTIDVIVIGLTAMMVAYIGWIDDHKSVRPFMRIVVHLLAAFFCIAYFGVPNIPLGAWMVDLGWWGWPLATVAMIWCVNFFNFMDGIDGIAAVEAVTIAVGMSIILALTTPGHVLSIYLWLLAVITGGFLVWNWSPAKVFMGDAASGFLGFLLAQFALLTSGIGEMVGVNVWCWLILFGVFFTDATVTLILRMIAREKLSQAHCQHAYQRLARSLKTAEGVMLSPSRSRANAHRTISLATAAVNFFWLTPLAVAAAFWPWAGIILTVVALTPLILVVLFTAHHTEPHTTLNLS